MKSLMKLLLLSILLCSCGKKTPVQKTEERPLRLNQRSMPRALDPRQAYESYASFFVKMLFDGLMRIGEDGEPVCALAESYTISEDKKTYTFYLRSAHWTNGKEITAYDFAYAWKSIINPKTATRAAHLFYAIKNVQKILQGEMELDAVGIYPLDAKTLRVELEFPAPYFLETTATAPYAPIPMELDLENPDWANETGEGFVSNGAFRLQAWNLEKELILVKNPTYWNAASIHLPSIYTTFVRDETTGLLLFQKGEIDWFGRPLTLFPPDALGDLARTGQVLFKDAFMTSWALFNVQKIPFNNQKLRLAFAYALDRQEIVDHLTYDSTSAMRVFNASLAFQEEPYFSDGNIEKARELFTQALEELQLTKETFPIVSFSASNSESARRITQAIQQQWQRAFDITVHVEYTDWNSFHTFVASGGHEIAYMGWVTWTRDPLYVLQSFKYADDGLNMTKWEDPRYQKLLDQAEHEADPIFRKAFLHDAERLLMEEMPFVPLTFSKMAYMKNPQLEGVIVSDIFDVDFTRAYWKTNAN